MSGLYSFIHCLKSFKFVLGGDKRIGLLRGIRFLDTHFNALDIFDYPGFLDKSVRTHRHCLLHLVATTSWRRMLSASRMVLRSPVLF
jgi:hypothetical protein